MLPRVLALAALIPLALSFSPPATLLRSARLPSSRLLGQRPAQCTPRGRSLALGRASMDAEQKSKSETLADELRDELPQVMRVEVHVGRVRAPFCSPTLAKETRLARLAMRFRLALFAQEGRCSNARFISKLCAACSA